MYKLTINPKKFHVIIFSPKLEKYENVQYSVNYAGILMNVAKYTKYKNECRPIMNFISNNINSLLMQSCLWI